MSTRTREDTDSLNVLYNETPEVKLYRKFFPRAQIIAYQYDVINTEVTDLERWQKALEFWAGNDYIGKNVRNLVDYYHELAHKQPKAEPILSLDNFK